MGKLQEELDRLIKEKGVEQALQALVDKGYFLHGTNIPSIKRFNAEKTKEKEISATIYPAYAMFFAIMPNDTKLFRIGHEPETGLQFSTTNPETAQPGTIYILSGHGFKEFQPPHPLGEYRTTKGKRPVAKIKIHPEDFKHPVQEITHSEYKAWEQKRNHRMKRD
ncbi:MAG: hypothetical protein GOV15_00855 [Candidatus Diapherotrites archaeon]|nr:hypothetical protein [Candidatus Diapherotrites archaeon]